MAIDKGSPTSRILVNGQPVTQKTDLDHNDRMMFGTTQLYVYANPKERDASKEKFVTPSFDMAQEEIAASSGFDMGRENKSQG